MRKDICSRMFVPILYEIQNNKWRWEKILTCYALSLLHVNYRLGLMHVVGVGSGVNPCVTYIYLDKIYINLWITL